jgi:hypothetical protein
MLTTDNMECKMFLAISKFLSSLNPQVYYHLLKMKFNKTDDNYFERK